MHMPHLHDVLVQRVGHVQHLRCGVCAQRGRLQSNTPPSRAGAIHTLAIP